MLVTYSKGRLALEVHFLKNMPLTRIADKVRIHSSIVKCFLKTA